MKRLYIFIAILTFWGNTSVASAKTIISDSAGYLSREEASQIEDTCDMILQQYDTSVFIITTEKLGNSDNYKKYIEEQSQKVGSEENLVILFISTKKKDSVCQITCYGEIQKSLTKKRMEKMTKTVEKKVAREKYYQAIDGFCDDVTKCLTVSPTLDNFIFQSIPQLIFSLLLGCSVVFYLLYPGKKKHTTLYSYLDQKQSRDLGHLDHFSHREVNILKDKKKSDNQKS